MGEHDKPMASHDEIVQYIVGQLRTVREERDGARDALAEREVHIARLDQILDAHEAANAIAIKAIDDAEAFGAEREREACAELAEMFTGPAIRGGDTGTSIARAIRARGAAKPPTEPVWTAEEIEEVKRKGDELYAEFGRPEQEKPCATCAATRWPVQGDHMRNGRPSGTISDQEAHVAYEDYARRHGREQSFERLHERGGFGYGELVHHLGSEPKTWIADGAACPDCSRPVGVEAMSEPRWRVGRTLRRTLYKDGACVGIVDTPDLARELVDAANESHATESDGRCPYGRVECACQVQHARLDADGTARAKTALVMRGLAIGDEGTCVPAPVAWVEGDRVVPLDGSKP